MIAVRVLEVMTGLDLMIAFRIDPQFLVRSTGIAVELFYLLLKLVDNSPAVVLSVIVSIESQRA